MATLRTPFYAEIADLIVPQSAEHEGVIAASERCIALIDQHWNRQVA
jgi:shikimate kinase